VSGYRHAAYAAALAEFGAPRHLPRCNGWVLESAIPDSAATDLRGCYPIFCCADWGGLAADLAEVRGPVAVTLVSDPFGAYDAALLHTCFPDLATPYKEHFVVELAQAEAQLAGHHARNIRKARAAVAVERCAQPGDHLAEWLDLYANLVQRHQIRGSAAFSRASFAAQLEVPGLVMYRAVVGRETVGMVLWYVQGDVGYYHLAAYSDRGYALRASYALFAAALAEFAPQLRWLSLGAGAGIHANTDDGLTRFKRGWATGTRTAYLCGRIFDHEQYQRLVAARGASGAFFPLYRQPTAGAS
jgi:hypothetical protein